MKISEVYRGNDPVQSRDDAFVELQMYAAGQGLVQGKELRYYDGTGAQTASFTFPSNVDNGGSQPTILIGDDLVSGDFTDSSLSDGTAHLPPEAGAVCFADPPATLIDCVGWGAFTGSAAPLPVGSPASPSGFADSTALKKPKRKSAKRKAKFKFKSSEAGSTFECKLDRTKWRRCKSPKKVRRLKRGKHKFKVRATDIAGNTDPTPAKHIYIKGFHKPLIMLEGLTRDTDAVVFVGYHARTGTEAAVLNESLLGKEIQNLLMDGEPIGEIKLNSLLAGHFDVPVVFLAGDDKACEEGKALLGDDLETFAVKEGIDKFSARCLHPDVTEAGIQAGVTSALDRLDSFSPFKLEGSARFGIDWNSTTIASLCSLIPTVEKVSPRVTEFPSDDLEEALGVIFVELLVGIEIAEGSRVYG